MRRNRKTLAATGLAIVAMASACAGVYVSPSTAAYFSQALRAEPSKSGAPLPQYLIVAQAAQSTLTLPGGASALSEAYQDWQVSCAAQAANVQCVFSQRQTQADGQRVLAIEVQAPVAKTAAGVIVLPFGLSLDAGVVLEVDGKIIGQPLRFRTCLPVGCVIPFSFDASVLAMLRTGAALKVIATVDGGGAAPFSISLKGFGEALDRVATLAR